MSSVTDQASDGKFSDVIKIEEEAIRSHVDEMVRESVEETLNGLLQAEADQLSGAACPHPLQRLVYARHGRDFMGCKSPVRDRESQGEQYTKCPLRLAKH